MMKYETVANDLKGKISGGTYAANSQLPSMGELCDMYGVSKITIKKAMDELEQAGLITRRRGSGSFVKKVIPQSNKLSNYELSSQMMGFCGEHSNTGEKVESVVHDFSVICPPSDVAECLGMDEDQFAYHIIRVRLADGKPLAIEYTYMPIDVIPDLRKKTLYASIYEYIEGDLGLKIDSAHRIVRAVMPTAEECDWLSITEDEPLLEIEQVGYLDDGTPFEYSVSKHPDSYEFRSISSK